MHCSFLHENEINTLAVMATENGIRNERLQCLQLKPVNDRTVKALTPQCDEWQTY